MYVLGSLILRREIYKVLRKLVYPVMEKKLCDKDKKFNFFQKFLEPENLDDLKRIKRLYSFWQPVIFAVMYLMYFISYLGRKSLCVGFNGDNGAGSVLSLPSNTYAILGIIYYAAYMAGKFLGGIIADRSNIRVTLPLSILVSSLFSSGIAVAGYLNQNSILSSEQSTALFMYVTWGTSAFIQSLTFPMCAKALVYWYSNKNRAYVWACFSTSAEVGSACSLLLAGFLLQFHSWESVFIVPTILGISSSILGFIFFRDNPSKVGLPDVESLSSNKKNKENKSKSETIDSRSYWEMFISDILKNKVLWILSLTYVCVYILRAGTIDWIPKMFMESGGFSPLMASMPVVILSVAGIFGTLSISFVSEKIFKGRRVPAITCYFILTTVCLLIFRIIFPFSGKSIITVPEPFYSVAMFSIMAISGVGIYGPQMMVGGIAAIETGSKKISSTISGITGSVGYLGSIISSFFGGFSSKFGYEFLANTWIIAGLIGIFLAISIWNMKTSADFSRS